MRKLFVSLLFMLVLVGRANAQDAATTATEHSPVMSMMGMHHEMMMSHFPRMATDENASTLFSGPVEHGVYIAPEAKYARIRGSDSSLLGLRAAWLVDHRFSIGGAGYMMANRIPAPASVQTRSLYRRYYSMGYGGALLGYTIAPRKLIHAEGTVLIGGGGIGAMHSHMNGSYYAQDDLAPSRFFVVEPGVTVEVNLTPYVRLDLGGGYRVVTGVNELGLENKDVAGPSASAFFKFGVL